MSEDYTVDDHLKTEIEKLLADMGITPINPQPNLEDIVPSVESVVAYISKYASLIPFAHSAQPEFKAKCWNTISQMAIVALPPSISERSDVLQIQWISFLLGCIIGSRAKL